MPITRAGHVNVILAWRWIATRVIVKHNDVRGIIHQCGFKDFTQMYMGGINSANGKDVYSNNGT